MTNLVRAERPADDSKDRASDKPPPEKRGRTEANGTPSSQASVLPHFQEHFTDPDIDNLRIAKIKALIYPQLLVEEFPLTEKGKTVVSKGRKEASDIVNKKDDRMLVVVGPCSIHDPAAAKEYAARLKAEADRLKDDLVIIMRVYFEKPRTTVGWKGLINDPNIDDTFNVNAGLRAARRLLQEITHLGLPVGCEFLDTLTPQYIADLVSWAAIGARTTECQLHRELGSGLSMPVGFKNSTSGDVDVSVDAVVSAMHPHCFFSITKQGTAAVVHSHGNPDAHIILRGGKSGPNYSKKHVDECIAKQSKRGITQGVMIDCSHGNSNKDYRRQPLVLEEIIKEQIVSPSQARCRDVSGVMIESNLFEGNQNTPSTAAIAEFRKKNPSSSSNIPGPLVSEPGPSASLETNSDVRHMLRYGVSITDGCVNWMQTVDMLDALAAAVRQRRSLNSKDAP
ncbi:Phospho-2-dehydro-3-deoxyheptonate aldolase, Phe-sensitive, putative [Perkinsus marinus ATCC 50983]|uniref:3-deoxy-7-phosphoheptulonate synthase n=1 Tax=Perkinsus marinus (strain ATCC 50983 / TXsc) TaxID=423536 RepID=C5LMC8_PERM5|nr:Phospho-2-dehydro-3-deoxyheptonate aldolase, Phe-sensitive, putative [Perkinsus marinus ATCC 50983]EER02140.1 Phospho-2-dehydro-3-deoxyheptonate aldolase, Phe-sensitive, putative [Perkinsus marinus ATCC 50983]|eukprot:XP_002769422.1 Phospho-2-dehydro-3-deoxyheptonate aldolase, Phe-sensitive, putative [Perkinsus marinus ATCC 50983]